MGSRREVAMRTPFLFLTLGLAALAFGCGKKKEVLSPSDETFGTGKVVLKVTYRRPYGLAKPAVVDRMTAYVYEADNTEITHKNLEKVGNVGRATITLSAGNDRKVSVVAYEDTLVKWVGWDGDVDVIAGQTTTAEIEMGYTVPDLELPDTVESDSYTVRWSRVPGGLRYELEENGVVVYTGANTVMEVTGKGRGSYSYRVRVEVGYAGKRYGYSPWSQASLVEVLPQGEIEVEAPWPSESPNVEGIEFVFVQGGTFKMGDLWLSGDPDERPAHLVQVGDFWMSKYEITVEQFERFVMDAGYRTTAERKQYSKAWLSPGFVQDNTYPVVCVSWYDAAAFCNWLSRRAGLEEVYDQETWEADLSKVGYRLPTEAEWEYAAKAGGKEIKYPNGDELTHDDANFYGTGGKDRWENTSPVGSFPPNELGLYDMAGNVYEWCNDWYDDKYYSQSLQDNPTGPASGVYKVLRGGSWNGVQRYCRTTDRQWFAPGVVRDDFGFRVVFPVR